MAVHHGAVRHSAGAVAAVRQRPGFGCGGGRTLHGPSSWPDLGGSREQCRTRPGLRMAAVPDRVGTVLFRADPAWLRALAQRRAAATAVAAHFAAARVLAARCGARNHDLSRDRAVGSHRIAFALPDDGAARILHSHA